MMVCDGWYLEAKTMDGIGSAKIVQGYDLMAYLFPIPVGATTSTSAPLTAASMISRCLPRKSGFLKAKDRRMR